MSSLISLATGEGSVSEESISEATALCEEIAGEGIVLLKNEDASLSFNAEDMASYDENNAKAYVLEAGDYRISIRSDSHEIIDEQTGAIDFLEFHLLNAHQA